MNSNHYNKSSNNIQSSFNQRTNKLNKIIHFQKSKEKLKFSEQNKNKHLNKNRLKQLNKSDKSNSKSRPKSNKRFGNRNNNKLNLISNIHKKAPNDENKNINIIPTTNQPEFKPKQCSFQIKKFNSDINNPSFFESINNVNNANFKKGIKIDIKKHEKKSIPVFENLKYIQLEDTNSLFNAWQNSSIIYKIFEEKLLKKNNFEINKNTLEIVTKSADANNQLQDQKFWILYIEYLINNNLLINEKQFLSVINEAFSYMTYNCTQLRIYYLQKIKKYAPIILQDGTVDDSDEGYINKLDKATINFIKKQKGVISSNIKLQSANKKKNFKLGNDIVDKEHQIKK